MTKTFRVNKELWKPIEDRARNDGISVNRLVNQILKTYSAIVWYDRFKGLMMSPVTLQSLIKNLSEEQIAEVGRESGSIVPRSILLMVGVPLNIDSLVYLLTTIYDDLMNWFQCDQHKTRDELVFHLRHDLGRKWSAFLNSYIQSMFKSVMDANVRTDVTDRSITVYARTNKLV